MMPKCTQCGNTTGLLDLKNGVCSSCRRRDEEDRREDEQRAKAAIARAAAEISVSTINAPPQGQFDVLGIVSAQTSYGMNVFRDIAVAARDMVGGRSGVVENIVSTARETCIASMREGAVPLGATDIVAIQFTYLEIGGPGTTMILVTATGTAIRVHP